jgi:predicted MPP superfamily phosphohydrolase
MFLNTLKMLAPIIFISLYAALEFYGWQSVKTVINPANLSKARWMYWGLTLLLFFVMFTWRFFLYRYMPREVGTLFTTGFVVLAISKLIVLFFLFPEDIYRGLQLLVSKFSAPTTPVSGISRSEFLSKVALATAAIPAATLMYGVVANAYNYKFRKTAIKFPNLPGAFDGFKIIQLSDIHAGSFSRKEPIIEVINKINAQNPDLIIFTGDLVNNVASEMDEYMEIFGKLKAKHGVISITGNHDYGDYVQWNSMDEKVENFRQFVSVHSKMGWDLLMNENRRIEKDGEHISIIGVENWGKGRFAKYGKLEKAYQGVEASPFKILLSHDPSHWDEKVRKDFPDIDLMFSGHTHGAQFGVENKWLKWSPSKYLYKQWAGLYQEGKQYLYVNRGFGFLFYPGRIGILPEVAEITLHKA